MAKSIWKYPLPVDDVVVLSMPQGAEVLSVQRQGPAVQIWALVDPAAEKVPRRFRVYGTGQEMPDDPGRYIGTFQVYAGTLVFHLFEGG